MNKIIKLLKLLHPISFTILFMVIFSSIVYYVDRELSDEKMDSNLESLTHNIRNYIIEELGIKLSNTVSDSLIKYCFVDTTTKINILGINTIDSNAIIKNYMLGYMKVRYSDIAQDTGKVDLTKMYLGKKSGIPYNKQVHKNPNGINIYPHFLITNRKDSLQIANNIMKFMNDNIDVFHKFNSDAGGSRRDFYLEVNDFGTEVMYIPMVRPFTRRTIIKADDTSSTIQSFMYINLIGYALFPLDIFIEGLLKYNIDITIKNDWNKNYIYGDSTIENNILKRKHSRQISVNINRGNDFKVSFAPNEAFSREWTFFPVVYVILFAISILLYITLHFFLNQIKKNENELEKANIDLRVANKTKDKLFSIISHDLKNSVGALSNIASIFQDYYTDMTAEETTKNINILVNCVSRIGKMLENILQWSFINMGSIKFEPNKYNIDDIVGMTTDNVITQANNKNIELIYENNSEEKYVLCDDNMINIVLRNLISNAIKFTEKGKKIKVQIDKYFDNNKTKDINDKYILISVIDEGIGIDKEVLDNLLSKDVKITTKGTANESGTGLGLILCKEFIDNHNCKIWVESEKGKGTKFKFTLPIAE